MKSVVSLVRRGSAPASLPTCHSLRSAASLAFSLLALCACNRDRDRSYESPKFSEPLKDYPSLGERELRNPNEQDRAGTTTLTGASSWIANVAAIDRLVASRCAREVSCSNVGPDKHFADGDACTREVRKKLNDELKTSACPNGIDGKELDECLDAIRKESCTNPVDTVSRLAACRTSELCLKIEAPRR
jgi:hypothetical protein